MYNETVLEVKKVRFMIRSFSLTGLDMKDLIFFFEENISSWGVMHLYQITPGRAKFQVRCLQALVKALLSKPKRTVKKAFFFSLLGYFKPENYSLLLQGFLEKQQWG